MYMAINIKSNECILCKNYRQLMALIKSDYEAIKDALEYGLDVNGYFVDIEIKK